MRKFWSNSDKPVKMTADERARNIQFGHDGQRGFWMTIKSVSATRRRMYQRKIRMNLGRISAGINPIPNPTKNTQN